MSSCLFVPCFRFRILFETLYYVLAHLVFLCTPSQCIWLLPVQCTSCAGEFSRSFLIFGAPPLTPVTSPRTPRKSELRVRVGETLDKNQISLRVTKIHVEDRLLYIHYFYNSSSSNSSSSSPPSPAAAAVIPKSSSIIPTTAFNAALLIFLGIAPGRSSGWCFGSNGSSS